jgi:hypothetical protein
MANPRLERMEVLGFGMSEVGFEGSFVKDLGIGRVGTNSRGRRSWSMVNEFPAACGRLVESLLWMADPVAPEQRQQTMIG